MRRLSENLEIQVTRIDQRTYHVCTQSATKSFLATLPQRGLLFSPPALCSHYVDVTLKIVRLLLLY